MNCYKQISRAPLKVSRALRRYQQRDSESFYYRVRESLISTVNAIERAARFIYLNKTAFNGIYRVNKKGQFNVPYGPSMGGTALPSLARLRAASFCLRNARILSGDFEDIVEQASQNDFVYLDPPYPPRSDTACFAHYSSARFDWGEQERVARVFRKLATKGCLVMVSNADQKRIISLYRSFRIRRLNTVRWLGSNGDRFGVREIVVTNYDPHAR
jgi:DNA adenine methylase